MPTLEATCSLDIGCPAAEFSAFCDQHPDRTVVVYANTSAAVKARSDWVVTSSIALDVVDHLDQEGHKILWAPDQHLGRYVQQQTGADMLLWDGSCVVHEEFKLRGLQDLVRLYPDAAVLVHPESPAVVIEMADAVGSTSQLIAAARDLPHRRCIVATDEGIFYKMQQAAPDKELIIAPTAGHGATCRSCGHCPWMAMNHLRNLADSLERGDNEIRIDPELGRRAMVPCSGCWISASASSRATDPRRLLHEAHLFAERGARHPGAVGGDIGILVTERNAHQDADVFRDAELGADQLRKAADGRLGTGTDTVRGHRQHQGLGVHAHVDRHGFMEPAIHADEGDMGRVEEFVVAQHGPAPPGAVFAGDAHVAVQPHRSVDLALAHDSGNSSTRR